MVNRKPTEQMHKFLAIIDPKKAVGLLSCHVRWVLCTVAVLMVLSLRGMETNGYYKSFGEWANACCPLGVWRFVESNGTERSFLVCPKTSKVYEIKHGNVDARKSVEINPLAFVTMYVPTNFIKGVAVSDMVGYICIRLKQGEVSFGYPYDVKLATEFARAEILAAPFDGDFICYSAGDRQFSACATFASDGVTIGWHDPQTFERIHHFPCPDADKKVCYYRRQGTNTTVSVAGAVKLKGSGFYSYLQYGIEKAHCLADGREIERENWKASLLGGFKNWMEELPKTSIRDPRRFYARLKDGRKAFAMVQEDHKHLVSPITHALLTVPRSKIVDFEPILDGAYPEKDCFSRSEVEDLYMDFSRPALSRWKGALVWLISQFLANFMALLLCRPLGALNRHRYVLFWINVLLLAGLVIWCACGD